MNWIAQYKNSLKMTVIEEPVDLLFYRPAGFIFAKIALPTRMSPNGVTIASMLFGVAAGILYAVGRTSTTIAAGLFFLIANTLDCADGQLARMKGTSSRLGRMIDGMADYVTGFAVLVGMGIGVAGTFYSPLIGWGLILAAAVSNTLQSMLVDTFRDRYVTLVKGSSANEKDEAREFRQILTEGSAGRFERATIRIYLGYLRLMKGVSPSAANTPSDPARRDRLIARYRPLMRGWTLIGSSMRISIAVVASLIGRPDYYLLAACIPINLMAIGLYTWQFFLESKDKG